MMTKKHYEQFAGMVRTLRVLAEQPGTTPQLIVRWLEKYLIDYCEEDNPRFDFARFRRAVRRDDIS